MALIRSIIVGIQRARQAGAENGVDDDLRIRETAIAPTLERRRPRRRNHHGRAGRRLAVGRIVSETTVTSMRIGRARRATT